jgi:hypothetical protein
MKVKGRAMSKRKTYIEKMEKQILQWDKEIDELLAAAGKTKAKLKGEYKTYIDKINSRKAAALKHLAELQESGEDSWEDLKKGFENSWKELRSSIERAKSRFNKD